MLKNEAEVQAHAARTQHEMFSETTDEIKPLTEEEKTQQKEKWDCFRTFKKLL